jgi:hypothetical protein
VGLGVTRIFIGVVGFWFWVAIIEGVLKAINTLSSRPFSFAVPFAKRSEGKVIAFSTSKLGHINY